MAYLTLNGFSVAVTDAERTTEPVAGAAEDTAAAALIVGRSGLRSVWDRLRTTWQTPEAIDALEGLLLGRGDVFHFDEATDSRVHSAKGLAPDATAAYQGIFAHTLATAVGTEFTLPKYGDEGVELTAAATNLLTENQASVETDTTGFTALGTGPAVIARDNTYSLVGSYSLKTTPTVNTDDGFEVSIATVLTSTYYAGSLLMKVASGTKTVTVQMRDNTGATGTARTVTLSTTWKRVEVAVQTAGAGVTTVYLKVTNAAANTTVWYSDALQIEKRAFSTMFRLPSAGASTASSLIYSPGDFKPHDNLTIMGWTRGPNNGTGTDFVSSTNTLFAFGNATDYIEVMDDSAPSINLQGKVGGAALSAAATDTSPFTGGTARGWHHVAAVMRRNPGTGSYKLELYVDGAQVATASPTSLPLWTSTSKLYLGNNPGGTQRLDGQLDDVVFLPYALTASMISAFYSFGRAFSDLPRLLLGGNVTPGGTTSGAEIEVVCPPTQSPTVASSPYGSIGTYAGEIKALDFQLKEVQG